MRHGIEIALILGIVAGCGAVMEEPWPEPETETRAGVRWWWMGSAVDKENIRWNLEEFAKAGIGTVEITPIYGVQGNESHDISFLSDEWMEMYRYTVEEAGRLGMSVDMNCGTGWPFGGPEIGLEDAACKLEITDGTLQPGRVGMMVKRAAPGGEGYVLDHFDRKAVKKHLDAVEKGFERSGAPYPATFFNDSYEVFQADWTPSLPEEFRKRRGYAVEDHLPELLSQCPDTTGVLHDYRQTLSELLLENFTDQFVQWAHSHGAKVRNQAHGGPGNLLDLYAAVDIPETEGFGLTDFGIKGLRKDQQGMTRPNDSDLTSLKYASSAAHVTGKRLTSAETFTWLTEHFRTSLSQMKPDLDLLFTCGINRVFIHGAAYSPREAPWPGWQFYASVDMSPTNSIWRDAPFLFDYIKRCQRFLQWGEPDADILLYFPIDDLWNIHDGSLLMMFDIHSLSWRTPGFIRTVRQIDSTGFDCDYASGAQLLACKAMDGKAVTEGGTAYKAVVIAGSGNLPSALRTRLDSLAEEGVPVIMAGGEDGMSEESLKALSAISGAEPLRRDARLSMIRRTHEGGHHYFIANLTPEDFDGYAEISVPLKNPLLYNPMDGSVCRADVRGGKVRISLRSGESVILSCGKSPRARNLHRFSRPPAKDTLDLTGNTWILSFPSSVPEVDCVFTLSGLQPWEGLGNGSVQETMGTGSYMTTLRFDRKQAAKRYRIALGDVRESARVYVNGRFMGCAWSAPFELDLGKAFQEGENELVIEVTNLPANRIAAMDRRGENWKRFKDINVVNLRYAPAYYGDWSPVPSGLNSSVKLASY